MSEIVSTLREGYLAIYTARGASVYTATRSYGMIDSNIGMALCRYNTTRSKHIIPHRVPVDMRKHSERVLGVCKDGGCELKQEGH